MRVFISYSRHDEAAVRSLTEDLKRGHVQVWLDEELRGGLAWWTPILREIRQCTVFLLALSNESLVSKPCRAECGYARDLGLPILPVQIGSVSSYRADPIFATQVVDYRKPTPATGLELMSALQECVAHRQAPPHPLPDPPPIPYEYLQLLGGSIHDSAELASRVQTEILFELMGALDDEDDETVVEDIRQLLRALRRRRDVTYPIACQIDSHLDPQQRAGPPPQTALTTAKTPLRHKGAAQSGRSSGDAARSGRTNGPPSPEVTTDRGEVTASAAASAFALGERHAQQGDAAKAAAAYQRAIRSGHSDWAPRAAINMGMLLGELGDLAGAEAALRLAIDSGHAEAPRAMLGLGWLHEQQGDVAAAAAAFQQTIESRHAQAAPMAANSLGLLRAKQDDVAGAACAYQIAIDSGHPDQAPKAWINLAFLQAMQNDAVAAKAAFQLVIDSGDDEVAPEAAFYLGLLCQQMRDAAGAKAAYQTAIDSGHAEWAPRAEDKLARMKPSDHE
jgi:tetratricopeptide (TPR) repeat protein